MKKMRKPMMYGNMARTKKGHGGTMMMKDERKMMKHGGKHNDRIMYAGGGEVLKPN